MPEVPIETMFSGSSSHYGFIDVLDIESTVTGRDRSAVDGLAAAYAREASNYVAASYPAYALVRLGADVVTAAPLELPPAVADRYLAYKAAGRL